MAKDFPTAVAFFQEASASKESPEDRELVNRAFRKRRVTADMIDDESDALVCALIREHMREGEDEISFDLIHFNGAQLAVVAERLRNAGFEAVANPRPPAWTKYLLITPSKGIRVRWSLAELARQSAQVAEPQQPE